MYKLTIDSSQRFDKSVTLIKIEDAREHIVETVTGDIDIAVAVEALLAKHKLTLADIDTVTPNLGPGSFTGLKIGVTVANVLEWALGKKTINQLYKPEYGKEPNIGSKKS